MIQSPQGVDAPDFDEIETAVMRTERGRWFLQEFARRRRADETTRILAAIDRLEARTAEAMAAETRTRLEAERSMTVLRELANLLRDFRPGREGRTAPTQQPRIADPPAPIHSAGELEARLVALANLDTLDIEAKLKLFGQPPSGRPRCGLETGARSVPK